MGIVLFLQRFMQPDTVVANPYSSQGWNRFSYVNNNPVNATDPSGNLPVEGCGDDGKSRCVPSEQEKTEYGYFLLQNEKSLCQAGDELHCSYVEKHPYESIIFVINSAITPGWTLITAAYETLFQKELAASREYAIEASLIPAGALYTWEISTGQYRNLVTGRFVKVEDLP